MKVYDKPTSKKFLEDMDEADLKIIHYESRTYEGPGVYATDAWELADVIASTGVRLSYARFGTGYMAFPIVPDAGQEVMEA